VTGIARCARQPLRLAAVLAAVAGCSPPAARAPEPGLVAGAARTEPGSVSELWRTSPERVRLLLSALDLDRPEMARVRAAAAAGDTVAAAEALLVHYRTAGTAAWLREGSVERSRESGTGSPVRDADQLLADTFVIQDVAGRVPRLGHGGLNWSHLGPHADREYGYLMNRHASFGILMNAWRETGESRYLRRVDEMVRDWVLHNPAPLDDGGSGWVRQPDPVVWRTLEAGLRMAGSWPRAFFGLQRAPEFTPAARLLMLSSIPEHARYLLRHHKRGHNWAVMEMNGLSLIALAFPEFRGAEEWYDHATEQMRAELRGTVYPDGVLHELTTHYHIVALRNFETFLENGRRAGRPVPAEFRATLEAMNDYLAYSLSPSGHIPMDNDGDHLDARALLLTAAERYGRPDWRYIATGGAEGVAPTRGPSVVFPWSGRVVMRDGWGRDAQWGFFDAGPWGTTHQHDDKLHLSIAAYGRDLLVDGGRYHYSGTPWRAYFVSSAAHNTVLVDGRGQSRESGRAEMMAKAPLEAGSHAITPSLGFARAAFGGRYEGLEGAASHTRGVVYLPGRFWVVVDRVETDRPRELQALWHFHPDCSVAVEGTSALSSDAGKGNLRVVPAGPLPWSVELVKGRETPTIQGWYSESYNHREPSPTAVYTARVQGPATFAWVLLPARGAVPRVRATLGAAGRDTVRVRVEEEGKEPLEVVVPLAGTSGPRIVTGPR